MNIYLGNIKILPGYHISLTEKYPFYKPYTYKYPSLFPNPGSTKSNILSVFRLLDLESYTSPGFIIVGSLNGSYVSLSNNLLRIPSKFTVTFL